MDNDQKLKKLQDDLARAEDMAEKARAFIARISEVFNEADGAMPRPWCATKKQMEKTRTWSGIESRLRDACRAPLIAKAAIGSFEASVAQAQKKAEEEKAATPRPCRR